MSTGRLPALVALTVALALGLAPWRVCAHADDDHARVYVLGLGHEHDHADEHADEHAPAQPVAHGSGQRAARTAHAHRACGPTCLTHGAGRACRAATHDHGHRAVRSHGGSCAHAPHGAHGHAHASPSAPTSLHVAGHDHDHEHPDGHCHCGDHPLVPGLTLTPVALDAHAPGAASTTCLAALAAALGTPEVVPTARPRGWRIACEEDPIVLLR